MKVTVIPLVIGALGMISKGLVRWMEVSEIGRQAETTQIIMIGQNTEKSPRDLRRLAVT